MVRLESWTFFDTEQHPSWRDFTSVFPFSLFVLYRPSIDTHEKEQHWKQVCHLWNIAMKERFRKKGSDIWKEILHKDTANRMVSDGNERETLRKSAIRKKSTPVSDIQETAVCR